MAGKLNFIYRPIIEEGAVNRFLYRIKEGRVRVEKKNSTTRLTRILSYHNAPSLFGGILFMITNYVTNYFFIIEMEVLVPQTTS